MPRRISNPRIHRPTLPGRYSSAARSASSRYAQSESRAPLVPSPADGRYQAAGLRSCAIASAMLATSSLPIQELNWLFEP